MNEARSRFVCDEVVVSLVHCAVPTVSAHYHSGCRQSHGGRELIIVWLMDCESAHVTAANRPQPTVLKGLGFALSMVRARYEAKGKTQQWPFRTLAFIDSSALN